MSGCECDEALRALEEYLHNELGAGEAQTIREHLAGCPACRQELLVNARLMEAVRRSCRERAPEQLRAEIVATIRRAAERLPGR